MVEKLSVQVVIATMNQTDHSLLDKMKIDSDAVVGNQCDRDEVERFEYNDHSVVYYSFNEKGVGLNRNNSLMRATADYCVLADDDMIFKPGYASVITRLFKDIPDADILCLNIDDEPQIRPKTKKVTRIRWYNYGTYGAARIALKREPVIHRGIFFNLSFGGGAEYTQGEDTLFLHDCLKKRLHIYAVPCSIAELYETRKSTWFNGYTEKFFFDKGIYLATLQSPAGWIHGLKYCYQYRRRFKENFTWLQAFNIVLSGMKAVRKRKV